MKAPGNPSEITPASSKDFDELWGLLNRANQHSISRSGLRLWTMMDHVRGQFRRQVDNGECFVLRDAEDSITSCISLTEEGPEWGEVGNNGKALYFHKWMKDPEKAGQEEPLRLLRFAAEEAIRRGKPFLRCDTVPSLVSLIKYYDKLGFRRVGMFVYESSGRPGILLEIEAKKLVSSTGQSF